jgi:hypothetical protein
MILDYTNIPANYDEVIAILTQLAGECESYSEFERRITDDYEDGLTSRLHRHVARQYGKEYISQIGDDFRSWVSFIEYMLDNSSFLNKGLKTRNRRYFDRAAFWDQRKNTH